MSENPGMEVLLTHQSENQISVTCNEQFSHHFDLRSLHLSSEQELFEQPEKYGARLYAALFPAESLTHQTLLAGCERLLLVAVEEDLDAIAWEYLYGPDGFLVQDLHFVRGLPAQQRQPAPHLDQGLHITAIPSQPLSALVPPLAIEEEWLRLQEDVREIGSAAQVILERCRPPTLEQVRKRVAGKKQRVVHFMGHGGLSQDKGAALCFEQENGDVDFIEAKALAKRLRGTTFLVTLGACVSASPGPTPLSNLAASLVKQRIPYALGMRISILDEDARTFSRVFYSELARGVSVEEALLQARLSLAQSARALVVGVPVLYCSLKEPASGFAQREGAAQVHDPRPPMQLGALPRAEGGFQGRTDDLKEFGTQLTGDKRARILTIHGAGGQGKTVLAREVVERFAHAFPDGIYATSLEHLPDREIFVHQLTGFLHLDLQGISDPQEIVLDNAETLLDALRENQAFAFALLQLLQQLPSSSVSLLVTSRELLGWPGEVSLELGGLSDAEGASLFMQSAPSRRQDITRTQAEQLSHKVQGHPLSLRLLAGAFNASAVALERFREECEEKLLQAENRLVDLEHRHRTLERCMQISLRYLSEPLTQALGSLSIFHAPFLAEIARAILDPDAREEQGSSSMVPEQLHQLYLRGLLQRIWITRGDGTLLLYALLPVVRSFIEHSLSPAIPHQQLHNRFGTVYANLTRRAHAQLDKSGLMVALVQEMEVDLLRGCSFISGSAQAECLEDLGRVLSRLGANQRGLVLLERALELAQQADEADEQTRTLLARVLNELAGVSQDIGQPEQAQSLFEQALPIMREVGDRQGEAATLNNLGLLSQGIGQPKLAQSLFEQALPFCEKCGIEPERLPLLPIWQQSIGASDKWSKPKDSISKPCPPAGERGIVLERQPLLPIWGCSMRAWGNQSKL